MVKKYVDKKLGDILDGDGDELIVYEIIDNEDGSIKIKGQINVYTKFGRFETHIEEDLTKED